MSDILFPTFSDTPLDLPFILHGLGIEHFQEPIRRLEGSPMFQWIQCLQGNGTVHMRHEEFLIKPGQGIFLYPETGHLYQSLDPDEKWVVNFIAFSGYGIRKLLENTQLKDSGVFTLSEPERITQILKKIQAFPPLPPLAACICHSETVYSLLLHLILYTTTNDSTARYSQEQRMSPVITYIEEHYTHPIYLDDMASLCGLSKEYLCQLFKTTVGVTIFDYIQQTRIRHSKEKLLKMPDLPAHTIGQMCGFNSSSYFNKIFKKIEHISPGEFRRQNGILKRH